MPRTDPAANVYVIRGGADFPPRTATYVDAVDWLRGRAAAYPTVRPLGLYPVIDGVVATEPVALVTAEHGLIAGPALGLVVNPPTTEGPQHDPPAPVDDPGRSPGDHLGRDPGQRRPAPVRSVGRSGDAVGIPVVPKRRPGGVRTFAPWVAVAVGVGTCVYLLRRRTRRVTR